MNKREMEGEGDDRDRERKGERQVGVLADSPALHSSLTVSPVFILFVGGGEAPVQLSHTYTGHTHTVARLYRCKCTQVNTQQKP